MKRPNFLIILTDQERYPRHWPEGWADSHLPAMQRLRRNGMTFHRAYTNACQCSPSRATLLTGRFPAAHGVLETFGPGPGPRPAGLGGWHRTLGHYFADLGYRVVLKGKWHLSRPVRRPGYHAGAWRAEDIDHLAATYGFGEWNPPDAGHSLSRVDTLGGGVGGHDRRFISAIPSDPEGFGEGARSFLQRQDGEQPFVLLVSLVNPHDVCVFPNKLAESGYRRDDFADLPIELPCSARESLAGKPRIQRQLKRFLDGRFPLPVAGELDYVRFYAWLHTQVDARIGELLDELQDSGLHEDTIVIRTSDHGEMGLAHGGLRQKEYNFYEETIRVPLVIANPRLFPRPRETQSLASLVDLLPTLIALAGGRPGEAPLLAGRDLTPILDDPAARVRDWVHFTYDDPFVPDPASPGFIRAVIGERHKYAVYFDPISGETEHESYDLHSDPYEMANLADSAGDDVRQALLDTMRSCGTRPPEIAWPDG